MSNIYHAVTAPGTAEIITAKMWNDLFVSNWNYLYQIGVGGRKLGVAGTAYPEPLGAMGWINGGRAISRFMNMDFTLSYPANTVALRVIASGLRSNYSAITELASLIVNNDGTAGNYDSFLYLDVGSLGAAYEFIGGAAQPGLMIGFVPGAGAPADQHAGMDMWIWTPTYEGSDDVTHYMGIVTGSNKVNDNYWGAWAHGRWKNSAAIEQLSLRTYFGTEWRVGGAGEPSECRVDIYAYLGVV